VPNRPYFKARADVDGVDGVELAVEFTWNPRCNKASACFFAKHVRPIWSRLYGIDTGEDHHNPDCAMTGDPHRHNMWSIKHGARFAAGAADLAGKSRDEVFEAFLHECGIQVQPPAQVGLFQ
jgi:hypothetical protein